MRRTLVSRIPFLSAAAVGILFLQCGGGGGKAVSGVALQETILERRVKGGESLLERIGKGKILDFNQVLVTVDQRLVAQLIEGATPYEQVIDDKYRIRVNSANVDFRANFALVELNGRGSLVGGDEEKVAADVKVFGVLEITGIDPKTGVLRAKVNVIGLEVPNVSVLGMSAPIQGLVDRLGSLPLDKLNSLASELEIPVALEQEVTIPQIGPEGEVKIAAATVPLRVAVQDVLVVAGKIWVTIGIDIQPEGVQPADSAAKDAKAGKQAAASMPPTPALQATRSLEANPAARLVDRSLDVDVPPAEVEARGGWQGQAAGQSGDTTAGSASTAASDSAGAANAPAAQAAAPPDSMTPRMKELQARYEALVDSIKVATAADTLLWSIAADSGEVAVGLKPELINHLVKEATKRYLHKVELDLNLGIEVNEGETVKVKAAFGKMVTAGSWKVHVTVHRIQAVLAAGEPNLSVVEANRLRLEVPVRAVSGYGTVTVEFDWDASGVVSAACHDFHAKVDADGTAVPRDYNVTGDLVLAAVGDRIVAVPEFPVQKIRVSIAPTEATWAKVRSLMAGLSDTGKCGIGMKVMTPEKITTLLTNVLTKGFEIKLPTKIVPTLTFPASVSESVKVEGRAVQLSVKPRKLLVTPQAFWYSANVSTQIREIQPEQNPPGAGEKPAEAGKGAT